MQRIHIVGRKYHGKTKLVVDLVLEFASRAISVGTIKHTHHLHELDVPGKDSHRHRTSGAATVGVLSRSMSAVFVPHDGDQSNEDRYTALTPLYASCDIVLVEGDSQTSARKIEVWRSELGTPPLAATDPGILEVVTDDSLPIDVLVLPRRDASAVADSIIHLQKSLNPTRGCS